MNKIVRHNNGSCIILGVQGDEDFLNKWSNLIHNYSIADKTHVKSDRFFYFITNEERFIKNYGVFIENQYFKNGLCKADEIKFFEKTAQIEAKDQLDEFELESFYHYYRKEDNPTECSIELDLP